MEATIMYFLFIGLPVLLFLAGMAYFMTHRRKRFREMTPDQAENLPEEGARYAHLDPDRMAFGRGERDLDDPEASHPVPP